MREAYEDPARRVLAKAEIIWEIERGLDMTAGEVHLASKRRSGWHQVLLTLFERSD